MHQAESQSGNETYEEPLRLLLIAAFALMKEVEPDYIQSSRSGPRRGVRCKDSASESDNDDNNSQDDDLEGAIAVDPKKSKRVAVRGLYDNYSATLILLFQCSTLESKSLVLKKLFTFHLL